MERFQAAVAKAGSRDRIGNMVPLKKPIKATLDRDGRDDNVSIIAVSDFLCLHDNSKVSVEKAEKSSLRTDSSQCGDNGGDG